jgi:hypothetical protein
MLRYLTINIFSAKMMQTKTDNRIYNYFQNAQYALYTI